MISKKISFIAIIFCMFFLSACSKGGDSPTPSPTPTPTPVAEADISFKVEIAGSEVNYSSVFAVVGTSVPINSNITSALPKDGVTIDVSVKKKSDNVSVFASSVSSSAAAANPTTITGLTPGVLCVVTVTVTSKTKSSNTSIKTFEMAAK